MPAQETEWTAEMARALPDDGNRYEVLDGELFVTPAPSARHQAVLARLFRRIDRYVEQHSLGWTRWSQRTSSSRRAVQPDLFVVPDEGAGEPKSWSDVKRLLLVVEALSPTTASADRLKKRPIYQQQGVPEYWIVDTDSRMIERWRPGDERLEIISDVIQWQPRGDVIALKIVLNEIFAESTF